MFIDSAKKSVTADNKLYSYQNQQIFKQSNEINNNNKYYHLAKKHKSGNLVMVVWLYGYNSVKPSKIHFNIVLTYHSYLISRIKWS